MVPIKNIGNLPPEFRRTERNEKQTQVKRSADVGARGPTKVDKAQDKSQDQFKLSDSARTMLQRDAEVRRFTAEMPQIETLGPDERQEIEAKIDGGFYSSPEVVSTVAGKVSETSSVGKPDQTHAKLTPTRMQEVLEKIQTSQYDSMDVLDVIADRIIKDL